MEGARRTAIFAAKFRAAHAVFDSSRYSKIRSRSSSPTRQKAT